MLSLSEPRAGHRRTGVWFSTGLSTRLPEHEHGVLELNLVVAGTARYRAQGQAWEVSRGQLLVLPAGVRHELVDASDDLAMWVVEADLKNERSLLERVAVVDPSPGWMRRAIALTKQLWTRPPPEGVRALELELEAWLDCIDAEPALPHQPLHPAVARARLICERSLSGDLEMGDLARQAGISKSRLTHLFQAQLGLSPVQYRNFARLQHFIRASSGKESTLLRAALGAGFGSYAQFHRVFLQVCGVAPGAHVTWVAENDDVDTARTLRDGAALAHG